MNWIEANSDAVIASVVGAFLFFLAAKTVSWVAKQSKKLAAENAAFLGEARTLNEDYTEFVTFVHSEKLKVIKGQIAVFTAIAGFLHFWAALLFLRDNLLEVERSWYALHALNFMLMFAVFSYQLFQIQSAHLDFLKKAEKKFKEVHDAH